MPTIHVDTSQFVTELDALKKGVSGDTFYRRISPRMKRAGLAAERAMKQLVSGKVLKVRSGALRGQIGTVGPLIFTNPFLIQMEIGVIPPGPADAYANAILEDRTIRPRRAKYLAIPLPNALTKAGVARYPSPLRDSLPRAFPGGTFVRRSRRGNLILFGLRVPGSTFPEPLFVLKKSVFQRGRDYVTVPQNTFFEAVEQAALETMTTLFTGGPSHAGA